MKNRLIIIGADFSANAIVGQIETSYSLRVDVESVEVSKNVPVTIYATSELQTYNDDVLMGSVPAPISVSATNGVVATVGDPDGSLYPIVIDGSAATAESCTVTIAQIGSSNVATVEAICQIYAIKRATNAPLMDVVYAQGWSVSPDYMTFDEAAAVTTFGATSVFKDNTEITNGEDFQHFTGLTTWSGAWQNMTAMTKIKAAGKPTTGLNAFSGCTSLVEIDFSGADMTACINIKGMLNDTNVEVVDWSRWTNNAALKSYATRPFNKSIKHLILPESGFGGNCTDLYGFNQYGMFVNMVKVDGWFDLSKSKFNQMIFTGVATFAMPELRKIEMRNCGTLSAEAAIDTTNFPNWGVNSAEVPDAEDSFKNTMRYLYDRASAGYDTCTITLSTNTKAILDADATLLAEVVAKGYTIA